VIKGLTFFRNIDSFRKTWDPYRYNIKLAVDPTISIFTLDNPSTCTASVVACTLLPQAGGEALSNFGYEPHVKMAKRDIQVKVDLKEDLNGFVSLKQMDERL